MWSEQKVAWYETQTETVTKLSVIAKRGSIMTKKMKV